MVRINRWLDFFDRVAWSFIAALPAGLSVDAIFNADLPWSVKLGFPALTAFFTSIKVVAAQNTGSNNLGALAPGPVIEPESKVAA